MALSAERKTAERLWIPLGLFLLAFIVRLAAAEGAAYGDELATIRETQNLGFNLNGIGFFVIYNFWISFSTDLLWLRALPICFGSLSVLLCYLWLRAWRPISVAVAASGLLAISPVAVEYSQQIRFYSFFLFAATLFFWLYALYTKDTPIKHPARVLWLGLCALLVLSAQMLGVLVIAVIGLHCLATRRPKLFYALAVVCIGGFLFVSVLAIISPGLLQVPYSAASRIFDGNANFEGRTFNYTGPRGWSPVIGVKLLFLGYHTVLGQYTYPLDLLIVLPAVVAAFLTALVGLWQLYKHDRPLLYFVLLCFAFAISVYVILDPLLPAQVTASANVRLVIWIVPIVLWLVAEGLNALRWRSLQIVAFVVVVGAQFYGLFNMVNAAWEKPDYVAAVRVLKPYATQSDTVILADGRSYEFISFNLRQPSNLESVWQYIGQADWLERLRERGVQRLVLVSNDFKEENRCQFSILLSQLSALRLEQTFADYPFFIYVFDLMSPQTEVFTPVSAYHMRYQDIRLPQTVSLTDYQGQMVGFYALPNCQGQKTWQVAVEQQDIKQVLIFSNIIASSSLQIGTEVAKLTLVVPEGEPIEIRLRYGQHTHSWDAVSDACSACESALEWRKRAALVGSSAYEGAYRDFTARVWATFVNLREHTQVERLEIEVLHNAVTFNVWAVVLR